MNIELAPEKWLEEAVKNGFIIEYDYNDFGKEEEQKIVGTGAFGLVRRAFLIKIQKDVALKSFNLTAKFTNREFVNELKLHNKVQSHENIINFYGLTKRPGDSTYTLVLEFANNGTLIEYLRENKENPKFDWKQKIELAKQLAGAISFLHYHNIVHRDLKSENVLVSNGKIKLSDFGISRGLLTDSTNLLTRVFGSINYSDPEHLRDRKSFSRTKKSDIYGLAMLLWEISSGIAPYKDLNTYNLLNLIVNKNHRETPVKGSPEKYVQLYQRCWESDPKNRPDAKEVLDTLTNFTEQDYEDVIDSWQDSQLYIHPNLKLSSIKFDDELTDQLPYPIYAENSRIIPNHNSSTSSSSKEPSLSSSSGSYDELPEPDNNPEQINNFPNSCSYDDGQFNVNDCLVDPRKFNEILLKRFVNLTMIKEDVGIIIEELKKMILLSNQNAELVYITLRKDFSIYSCLIGFFEEFGIGTEISELKALGIYLQESQNHESIRFIAQLYLVRFLEKINSCANNDRPLLLQWFSRITSIMHGSTYLEHVKQLDKRKIFGLFENYANGGNSWGLYSVAWCYLMGVGVDKNEKEAFEKFLEAANKQNSLAQFQLSMLYMKGIGTNKNLLEGEKWIKKAEKQKDHISIPYIQNFINSALSNNN